MLYQIFLKTTTHHGFLVQTTFSITNLIIH